MTPSVKYIVVVGDEPTGSPRTGAGQHLLRERARLHEHVLRHHEQPVPEQLRAQLPADRRYPGGRQLPGVHRPYVPELAVGRLVETPAQITSQIDQYITRNGAISPTRSLTTATTSCRTARRDLRGFKARTGRERAGADQRQLVEDQPPERDVPDLEPAVIDSINAHYDHFRSLPADQNAAQREVDPLHDSDLADVDGRALDLHYGLPLGAPGLGLPRRQAAERRLGSGYAAEGAVGYMGNTATTSAKRRTCCTPRS